MGSLGSKGMHEDGGCRRTKQQGDAAAWWRWSHTAARGCTRMVAVVANSSEAMQEDGGGGRTQQRVDA